MIGAPGSLSGSWQPWQAPCDCPDRHQQASEARSPVTGSGVSLLPTRDGKPDSPFVWPGLPIVTDVRCVTQPASNSAWRPIILSARNARECLLSLLIIARHADIHDPAGTLDLTPSILYGQVARLGQYCGEPLVQRADAGPVTPLGEQLRRQARDYIGPPISPGQQPPNITRRRKRKLPPHMRTTIPAAYPTTRLYRTDILSGSLQPCLLPEKAGLVPSNPARCPDCAQLSSWRKSLKMFCRPPACPLRAHVGLHVSVRWKRPVGSWRVTGGADQADPGGEQSEELRHADAGGRAGGRSASRRQPSNLGRRVEGAAHSPAAIRLGGVPGEDRPSAPGGSRAGGQPGLQPSARHGGPAIPVPHPGISPGCQTPFRDGERERLPQPVYLACTCDGPLMDLTAK